VKLQDPLTKLDHCPACLSKTRLPLFVIKESKVFQCVSCSLRYLDPCLSLGATESAYSSEESLKEYHDFYEGYYEYGDLSKKTKTRSDFQRGLELLQKHLGTGAAKSILDVGFGNGFFLAVAKQAGWRVDGIDTSKRNVEIARQNFSLSLSQGNLERDIPDRSVYDAISFWDLIEHLPNPDSVLEKTYRILRSQGAVLVALPNDHSLLAMAASFLYNASRGWFKTGIHKVYFLEHVAYYQLTSLHTLFQRHHFVLRDYFYTSTDLDRYKLPLWEKLTAGGILGLGRILGLENRLVAVFQKR